MNNLHIKNFNHNQKFSIVLTSGPVYLTTARSDPWIWILNNINNNKQNKNSSNWNNNSFK